MNRTSSKNKNKKQKNSIRRKNTGEEQKQIKKYLKKNIKKEVQS